MTTGEPAGIGPELIVQLLQDSCAVPFVVLGDSELLLQRAAEIGLELALTESGVAGPGATARVEQVALRTSSLTGQLDQ
ncbi:MAG: 4-hydroxythreonine-4-phosphate dehydrogenase, partial [Pseudomonadota bacterium]|nr:4-hydroxythreonine-4-phosphate dehydrogenase [Pseudomonadota bacterium]